MRTLEENEVCMWNYRTFLDVAERLPYFIEEVYNKKRLHLSLNYLTPEEFETKLEPEKPPQNSDFYAPKEYLFSKS